MMALSLQTRGSKLDAERMDLNVHVPTNASHGVVCISKIGIAESASIDIVTRRGVNQGFNELVESA